MQLAAYHPVLHLLKSADCRIVIVATGTPAYAARFARDLGFPLPGVMVFDPAKTTHDAAGLVESVFHSIVAPIVHGVGTFGWRAIWEALYVSLRNATAGHGSSWRMGGTLVLDHPKGAAGAVTCTSAWRERWPGDWKPIKAVLEEDLGIADAPDVDFRQRLAFVIAARHRAAAAGGAAARPECTDDSCSVDFLKKPKKEPEPPQVAAAKRQLLAGGALLLAVAVAAAAASLLPPEHRW